MTETITEYIQRDLRARLQTEGEFPEDQTLETLSRHYRVSVTPVRRAVRALDRVFARRIHGKAARRRARRTAATVQTLAGTSPGSTAWHCRA